MHRLDKDTSGVMVVAKTELALQALSAAFAARDLDRAYLALAWGVPAPPAGEIEGAIGRDPRDRKRMAVTARGGKPGPHPLRDAPQWRAAVVAARMPARDGANPSDPGPSRRARPPAGRRPRVPAPYPAAVPRGSSRKPAAGCSISQARRSTRRGSAFVTRRAEPLTFASSLPRDIAALLSVLETRADAAIGRGLTGLNPVLYKRAL